MRPAGQVSSRHPPVNLQARPAGVAPLNSLMGSYTGEVEGTTETVGKGKASSPGPPT